MISHKRTHAHRSIGYRITNANAYISQNTITIQNLLIFWLRANLYQQMIKIKQEKVEGKNAIS